jgi:glyoxylase-like metal-dependent hydrolase (beta-lactamase superfamily II)
MQGGGCAGSLGDVLVRRIVARAFETNCFIVAPAPGEECIIIDPGVGTEDLVDAVLRENGLKPAAVLLTHGHLDHVFAVVPVCGSHGVPALIHPDDRLMMADPASAFGMPPGTPVFGRLNFGEPDDVRVLTDGETLEMAGLQFAVDHTPGHTPGSVTFRSQDRLFSGDLLFRGSIGRTDLPGGSYEQLLASLERTVLPLPDETRVHCGHLDDTTVGLERATNPFLAEIAQPGSVGPVTRGL